MGDHLAGRIAGALGAARRHRTLVLGLTFKENLPDLRNSKVVDLVRGLTRRGHQVDVHDPLADPKEAQSFYGIELVAPFWSRYLFAYLDYNDPLTFRLKPKDLMNLASQRAFEAILRGEMTDTGLAFRGM
jgi:UDP-glucose 6-dehydrogenase